MIKLIGLIITMAIISPIIAGTIVESCRKNVVDLDQEIQKLDFFSNSAYELIEKADAFVKIAKSCGMNDELSSLENSIKSLETAIKYTALYQAFYSWEAVKWNCSRVVSN